jgi:hypothetical protein
LKKVLSLFICFSLFLSIPFSVFATDDESIEVDEGSNDSSLMSVADNQVWVGLYTSSGQFITGLYENFGESLVFANSNVSVIRIGVSANVGSLSNFSSTVRFNLSNIRYQSSYAYLGYSPGNSGVQSSNFQTSGMSVGSSGGSLSVSGQNNTSVSLPYLWYQINVYQESSGAQSIIQVISADVSTSADSKDYTDILNTINSNILGLQGSLNNVFTYLSSISDRVSHIASLTNTISNTLTSFRDDVSSFFNSLFTNLNNHFTSLTNLLTSQFNSWISTFNDYVDLFTNGNDESKETVENTDKTNDELGNVTNEHDKIEQDMTGDFNNAIADVDLSQGTDFLTSMSASFTWVGNQMNQLFNLGGQIQYLLMYSLILGFALVLIGRGLK